MFVEPSSPGTHQVQALIIFQKKKEKKQFHNCKKKKYIAPIDIWSLSLRPEAKRFAKITLIDIWSLSLRPEAPFRYKFLFQRIIE